MVLQIPHGTSFIIQAAGTNPVPGSVYAPLANSGTTIASVGPVTNVVAVSTNVVAGVTNVVLPPTSRMGSRFRALVMAGRTTTAAASSCSNMCRAISRWRFISNPLLGRCFRSTRHYGSPGVMPSAMALPDTRWAMQLRTLAGRMTLPASIGWTSRASMNSTSEHMPVALLTGRALAPLAPVKTGNPTWAIRTTGS